MSASRPLILVTCFEPFGGSHVNPTMAIVKMLESMPCGRGARSYAVLPVVGGTDAGSAWATIAPLIESLAPDAVVALGESAKADAITFERVAVNLRDSRIADNAGVLVVDEPVIDGGADAFFTTLPVRELAQACLDAGVPPALSLSAGSFLCNEVMYRLLADERVGRAGFIHVPQLPEQSYHRGGPMMEARVAAAGVHAALEALAAMIEPARIRADATTGADR
jgi:pyroglutamyl-peptidase